MALLFVVFFLLLCTDGKSSEVSILLDFKKYVMNSGPRTNPFFDSWNATAESDSPCRFSGITCNDDGKVTEIDIARKINSPPSVKNIPFRSICSLPHLSKFSAGYNNLIGVINSDIRRCKNLEHLDLANNKLTVPFPDLSSLSRLQLVNLTANEFTGPFPDSSFLGNLTTNLSLLLLGDNNFNPTPFPVTLFRLTNLQWLYLSNCSITGQIPPEIGNLKKLINLELSHNYITGHIPLEITKLTNLWQLELYNNLLTGTIPPGFGRLNKLANFDASTNQLQGNLSEIRFLTGLVSLQLFQNNFSGDVPLEFGHFKNLTALSLYTNHLTGELPNTLGSWSDFDFIDVSTNLFTGRIPPGMCNKGKMTKLLMLENNFTGEIPATYGSCVSLQRFRVSDNSLSGVVPEGIWSLPNVDIIDLAINNFSGSIATGIGNAKHLTELSIQDNQFTGHLPKEISGAGRLVKMNMMSNRFTGDIPPTIGELKDLNFLILSGNQFSGRIPDTIGECSSLTVANFAGNSLTGNIPSIIAKLQVLNSLNLSDNLLSGEIPESLSSLKLSVLDLSNNQLSGRVPVSLVVDVYRDSFVGNSELCGYRVDVDFLRKCSPDSKIRSGMVILLCTIVISMTIIGLLWFLFMSFLRRWRKGSEDGGMMNKNNCSWDLKSFQVLTFDEEEIMNGLVEENLIGKGGSGKVYKVVLSGEKTFAVKHMLNKVGKGRKSSIRRELESEVSTLSTIRHVNVVKLYCSITNEESSLLVYEYLPNGSLWDGLHGVIGSMNTAIDWDSRYKISLGAAKGLEYLHFGCGRAILHRDVKSSNILLDENLKPRIADFGLAKILQGKEGMDESTSSSIIAGTHGYIAPEYAYTYKVTEKSDVYSFGVVLLELVTGRRPIESEFGDSRDVVHWVYSKMDSNELLLSALDPIIPKEMQQEAVKVLKVGLACTVKMPSLRPSMRIVVQMLEYAAQWRSVVEEDKSGTELTLESA